MRTVSIIGAGRMGGALAIALSESLYSVDHLYYRSALHTELLEHSLLTRGARRLEDASSIDSDIVLITTSDAEISAAADASARLLKESAIVLHTSGSLSSDVLKSSSEKGNPTGSMHPLVSVSSPRTGASRFHGAFFCLEGGVAAVSAAEEMVTSLGGRPFSIDARHKPMYHASAVLASGHVVALFQTALETLTACGLEKSFAAEALLPLVASTVTNLAEQAPEQALTGPFARSDLATIERHLEAFDKAGLKRTERVYLELGSIALDLAELKDAPTKETERIRERIKLALARAR